MNFFEQIVEFFSLLGGFLKTLITFLPNPFRNIIGFWIILVSGYFIFTFVRDKVVK